ncbi:MAG: hypothetical protein JOZ24_06225, partial [Candidatus Eremiobacteraeota bacterium]|nr:hypothetical protein [Candidatus Eremiobacteraeota bacterium]
MMHDAESAWPPLAFARWAPTKRTIHLIAQMLGKLRLALAPLQSNFLFTALFLTPSGFTTGPIPVGARLIEAEVDLLEARITVRSSDGRRSDVAFTDLPSIAGTYEAFLRAVAALDVEVTLSPIPQEIPDQTPLDRDGRPPAYVAADARSWLTVACATHGAFDRWRAHFHGRTGLQLWWGAFDVSLLLFSGRRVAPPADRGYLFKYDLDAEMMSA